MKRLLVFQHVPHEILGTFNPQLKDAGFRIRYVNFGRTPDAQPNVEKYDGLIDARFFSFAPTVFALARPVKT